MSGKSLRDKALLDTDWRVRVAGVQAHSAAGDVSAIAQRLSAIATEFKTSVDRIAGPDRHEVVALFEAALNHPSRRNVVHAAEEIYAAVKPKNLDNLRIQAELRWHVPLQPSPIMLADDSSAQRHAVTTHFHRGSENRGW